MKYLIICPCGKEMNLIHRFRGRKYCSIKCRKTYYKRKSGLKYEKHKENPTSFKKGQSPWNKGKKYKCKNPKQSKGYINSHGYLVFYKNGKEILAHRMIWEKYHGKIPKMYVIHHKDRNKLNNDIFNLQLTTSSEHSKIHYPDKKERFTNAKKK